MARSWFSFYLPHIPTGRLESCSPEPSTDVNAKPGTACSLALGLGKAKPSRALKGSPHTLYAGRGGLADLSKDAALSPRSPSLLPHDRAWVGSRTCRPQHHQNPASPPPSNPPSLALKTQAQQLLPPTPPKGGLGAPGKPRQCLPSLWMSPAGTDRNLSCTQETRQSSLTLQGSEH